MKSVALVFFILGITTSALAQENKENKKSIIEDFYDHLNTNVCFVLKEDIPVDNIKSVREFATVEQYPFLKGGPLAQYNFIKEHLKFCLVEYP